MGFWEWVIRSGLLGEGYWEWAIRSGLSGECYWEWGIRMQGLRNPLRNTVRNLRTHGQRVFVLTTWEVENRTRGGVGGRKEWRSGAEEREGGIHVQWARLRKDKQRFGKG